STASRVAELSRVSCRLEADSAARTLASTLLASRSCVVATFAQTSPWLFRYMAANFNSLVERQFEEELKQIRLSPPRFFQRPLSTHSDASGILPDWGGTIRSYSMVLSCLPPFTMSPARIKMSSLGDRFST